MCGLGHYWRESKAEFIDGYTIGWIIYAIKTKIQYSESFFFTSVPV